MDALRARASSITQKLERLMEAYLDRTISLDEYRVAKAKLVEEKQEAKDELSVLEQNDGNWFEPAIRFVKAAKITGFVAETATEEEKLDFLKNVGSNLTISDRNLSVTPRGAWKLVVDQGHVAPHNAALAANAAACVGKPDHVLYLAERGRVETAQIHNLLLHLYLHLKAANFKDLARLVDVLSLHGFLPSFDAR